MSAKIFDKPTISDFGNGKIKLESFVKNGVKVLTSRGFTPLTEIEKTTWIEVGILPEEYRPKSQVDTFCILGGTQIGLLEIKTNGVIRFYSPVTLYTNWTIVFYVPYL